ncbi:glycosyltransferase [Streptomyces sp. VRA16 Mangrove soil]|uniref:glycosyltransferase n=1 Tax=Streptomyces sp. VRA16 Mangrove soil TaxID=2817434 RepID=UPI001A9EB26D|nr:glycosyltransferase [Streptomyces sp. VRA16 Mangrove soil]MBO1337400.1 glycosyltransferase [Streptomyces sp. VRA16 Mangrove soil]
MKVLHVITGLGAGGAEQQLRLLVRHLPGTHEVVTLTNPGQVAEGLRSDGVRVAHLGMAGNRDVGALPRLVRLIGNGRYDVVHTHLYRACLYGRVAARMAGVRAVVATEHSLGEAQIEGRPLTSGVRALYLAGERLGRATIAVSPAVAGRLRRWGVPGQRVHVVPNGVDTARFAFDPAARGAVRAELGLPADAFVIGGVGRLVPGKRFDVLIAALRELPADVRLLLVGTGPQEQSLRRAAGRAGVLDRVVLAGERPHTAAAGTDLPALMSAMDILASPSVDEAFGLAVVEAQAAGLPVLYVTCPAVDDLPAGTDADAVRVPCEPGSFVREVLRIREEPGTARTPSPAALHYSIARSAVRHQEVYATATGAQTPGVMT